MYMHPIGYVSLENPNQHSELYNHPQNNCKRRQDIPENLNCGSEIRKPSCGVSGNIMLICEVCVYPLGN